MNINFPITRNYFYLLLIIFYILFVLVMEPLPVMANQKTQFLFDQALDKIETGDCLNALKNWDKVLKFSPNDVSAITNRGNCLFVLGNPQAAIDAYSKALSLEPINKEAHLNRGIAEESLNRLDDAQADYYWVLKKKPEDTSGLYNLANVKGAQGQWKESKILFEKVLFVKPDFVMAKSRKALVEYQLGELEQAESDLRSIIRQYPMFADPRAALSALLSNKGSLGEAQSHWAAVLGLDPRYEDQKWIENICRWPPNPINDLMNFLTSGNS